MAVGTITKVAEWKNGNKREAVYDVVGPTSYTTDGDSLTAANLGYKTIHYARAVEKAGSGFEWRYDHTNSKLKCLCPGVVTTAAGAGTLDDFPLSGTAATAASIGLTAGNATTRFGAMPQVASTVDLSGETVRIHAIGY